MLKNIIKYTCMGILVLAGLMSIIATGSGGSSGESSSTVTGGAGAGK